MEAFSGSVKRGSQFPPFFLTLKSGRLYASMSAGSMEKALRDLSGLTRTVITDKNGHRKTVYVRPGKPEEKNRVVNDKSRKESGFAARIAEIERTLSATVEKENG